MKLKEQSRVVLCHVPLGEVVQRYIFSTDILLLRKRAKHGRFARLTWPGHQDRGVRFTEFEDAGFHVSADVSHKAHHFSADFDSDYIIAEKRGSVNRISADFRIVYKSAEKDEVTIRYLISLPEMSSAQGSCRGGLLRITHL